MCTNDKTGPFRPVAGAAGRVPALPGVAPRQSGALQGENPARWLLMLPEQTFSNF